MEEKKKLPDKLTFEDALSELEEIAEKLEEGNLSLDDSIAGFERGTILVKFCQAKLEEAERKIEILQKADSDSDGDSAGSKGIKKKKIKVKENTGEVEDDKDLQGSLL